MIHPEIFFNCLTQSGVGLFSGVPDSLLKNVCAYITDNTTPDEHIIAANEGNALAIGIGYHLASNKIPLIYMQNSGLGNIVNPLLSLADSEVYSIPIVLLIGWRGEPGVKDEPQHKKQGRVTRNLLDSMEIPYELLTPDMDAIKAEQMLQRIVYKSKAQKKPCALLVRNGSFSDYKLQTDKIYVRPLLREQALEKIVSELDERDIVVSTTGVTSRELFEFREKQGQGHEKDFLTVGGMGHASQIALGIAIQKKNRQVFCLDGDGALLMHMGALAINASMGCKNFKHIVFNNSAHDSVGGQPTVADQIDIQNIALSSGYRWVKQASTPESIQIAVKELRATSGPAFLEIQVKTGFRSNLGRPTITPIENKKAFMAFQSKND